MLEYTCNLFLNECPIFGMCSLNNLHSRHLAFGFTGNYITIISIPAGIETLCVDYIKRTGNTVDNGFIEILGFVGCFPGIFQIGYINNVSLTAFFQFISRLNEFLLEYFYLHLMNFQRLLQLKHFQG